MKKMQIINMHKKKKNNNNTHKKPVGKKKIFTYT